MKHKKENNTAEAVKCDGVSIDKCLNDLCPLAIVAKSEGKYYLGCKIISGTIELNKCVRS